MVVRSAARSKFKGPQDMKTALNTAIGETIEGEFVLTQQNAPADGSRDVSVAVSSVLARPSVSVASAVKAMDKALHFSRGALYIEVAVALAVFASSSTGADLATKRTVMEVYEKAGYDVSVNGADYKTVSRRINASAKLFDKLGQPKVLDAMHGLRDLKAIDSLGVYLGNNEDFSFRGINDILEYVGQPVKQTNTPEAKQGRLERQEAAQGSDVMAASVDLQDGYERLKAAQKIIREESVGTIVSAGHMSMVVEPERTTDEIRAMGQKLIDYANRIDEDMGTLEEQHDREMHS